ncbi:type VII secretion-associated serine protease mycosin [Nonomuraea sp. NPDC059194]|uniref:type VII secretion-associated serine protease mycosin n=1 Tax=Nonomuraea sp. NPDC059194 TaxID=3346764 RepID=UPI0036B565BC
MVGRVLLAVSLAMTVTLVPLAAEAAPAKCDPQPEPGLTELSPTLWAQTRMDTRRVWPLTRGEGVTVAVIDSGVDSKHPLVPLRTEEDLTSTGNGDCVGHGTAVAGIIAGRYRSDLPFYGVAPAVTLVSLKQTNKERGDPAILVAAITRAADMNVDVINISTQTGDMPALRAAVQYALAKDIVIVAAAGNSDPKDKEQLEYPAAYDGVLSVGSVGPEGQRSVFSNTKSNVAVMAPGQAVTSTWPGGLFMEGLNGTSYAAPYVAGVAALVRSRYPKLTQEQVRRRIEVTADGALGAGTGAGVVNPLLAVTSVLPNEQVELAPPLPPPLPDSAIAKAPAVNWRAITIAAIVAASALVLAGVILVTRLVAPMGKRRGWRAGRPK